MDVNLPIIIVSKLLANRRISCPLGAIWQRCKVPSLWRRLGVFLGDPVLLDEFGIDVCYARPPQRCWVPRPRYGTCARVLQDMWPDAPDAVCLGSRVGMAGYATGSQNVEND